MAEQMLAGELLAIDERSEPRSGVNQDIRVAASDNLRVIPGDVAARHLQIGAGAAADCEDRFVDGNGAKSLRIRNGQPNDGHGPPPRGDVRPTVPSLQLDEARSDREPP